MLTAFYTRTDIRMIIKSLPVEEREHMCRVGMLVGFLAEKIDSLPVCQENINRDVCEFYGVAAAYHDIGKAWIPKNLLTKSSKLTEEEAAVMYKHPEFARMLFDQISDGSVSGMPRHLIRHAFNSAVYHHEWWNGKGYPYGIGFENIPLIARITSVCDAYDAMTSKRVYRDARSHDYACRELKANAGIQFDPALVQIFLDNASELIAYI